MSNPMSEGSGYRVLARKYRPADFSALIGQDAMVRTLGNAIARGALAHAYLLTGVRGVGKTSTARIIAKALNCIGRDGTGGPTIEPCGSCEPCCAIAEGRHIDVVEMDAASNTGVDDVREIIEAVRYAAVSARYKIYIIDEVHMLSRNAFNALLKTLEEPPAHVKFIFATTEVHKLPVTVLSRCQRFDLRRIPAEQLAAHFGKVSAAEGAAVEPEALTLVARAAEGSVRDGLSILDQAIAHGQGVVTAQAVRDMLGLSDRGRVRELMAALLTADAPGALRMLRSQYDLGVNPDMIVQELLELTHAITRFKVAQADDIAMGEAEREAIAAWAARLGYPALHRLWQLLLKGLSEVQTAPLPIQAAEMAVLRIVHASTLPDPGELVRRLTSESGSATVTVDDARAAGPQPPLATVDDARAAGPQPPLRSEPVLPSGTAAPLRLAAAAEPRVTLAPPQHPAVEPRVTLAPPQHPAVEPPVTLAPPQRPAAEPAAAPVPLRPAAEPARTTALPADFAGLVALFEHNREPLLAHLLHDATRLVRYAPPILEIAVSGARPDFAQQIMRSLQLWTGVRWTVMLSDADGQPTLREQEQAALAAEREAVLAHPTVRRLMDVFPNAELIEFGVDPDAAPTSSGSDTDMRRA